jgi:hypothetical protein
MDVFSTKLPVVLRAERIRFLVTPPFACFEKRHTVTFQSMALDNPLVAPRSVANRYQNYAYTYEYSWSCSGSPKSQCIRIVYFPTSYMDLDMSRQVG